MCGLCGEQLQSHANTLTVVSPCEDDVDPRWGEGPIVRFFYSDGVMMDPNEDWDRLSEELQRCLKDIILGTVWHSTDAWRGHIKVPATAGLGHRWTRVLDGWHSSMEHSDLAEACNALGKGETELDFPVVLAFLVTSNVCSIGLSIYTREEDVEAIKDYFRDRTPQPPYAGFNI